MIGRVLAPLVLALVTLLVPAGATAATARPDPLGPHPRIPSDAYRAATLMVDTGAGGTSHGAPARPLLDTGRALYGTHCASCHGADLRGVAARANTASSEGTGGPALRDAGGAAVDFYVRTGRMPLAVTGLQAVHEKPHFDEQQIAALEAYVDAHAAVVPIPAVRLDTSLLQAGRKLFEDNCQACHGAGAQGATAGYQWIALPLDLATPVQIGEAIRVGPGVMPRWNAAQFSERDVDALATYVRYLAVTPQDYGGTTLGYLGPVAEGLIGAILGVGALFWVIYFTGTKDDGSRVNDR